MLRPKKEYEKLISKIGIYMDPVLENRQEMLKLCRMLRQASMLGTTTECVETVDFFAVVKKCEELGTQRAASGGASGTTSSQPSTISSGSPSLRVASGTASPLLPVITVEDVRRWDILERLIMGGRFPNLRWRMPPRTSLSSPVAIADLDCSPEAIGHGSVAIVKADCPNCCYRLFIEAWQLPHSCIRGISTEELNRRLAQHGLPLVDASGGRKWVAVKALLMGWGWSVWVARTVLEDLLSRGADIFLSSARL